MLDQTIADLEGRIKSARTIGSEERSALLKLVGNLKEQIAELSRTHAEQATSIAGFTQVATHEAIRGDRNASLLKIAREGLEKSVEEFELTHPLLVDTIREISDVLSNLGI